MTFDAILDRRLSPPAADPRFDAARHPHETHRFGWVVELESELAQHLALSEEATASLVAVLVIGSNIHSDVTVQ